MAAKFGALVAGTLVATAMAGSGAGLAAGKGPGDDPLAGYRWKSRVLVLAAPAADDPHLRAQREALASARGGTAERDLVVVEAVGAGAEAGRLRKTLGLPGNAFRAVLVGKDGGAKLSSAEPIPPQRIFSTIDAMPMRQDEMENRKGRR